MIKFRRKLGHTYNCIYCECEYILEERSQKTCSVQCSRENTRRRQKERLQNDVVYRKKRLEQYRQYYYKKKQLNPEAIRAYYRNLHKKKQPSSAEYRLKNSTRVKASKLRKKQELSK